MTAMTLIIQCPWCSAKLAPSPPRVAVLDKAGHRVETCVCHACRGEMVLVWDDHEVLEVRPKPTKKLRWQPSYDGPVSDRTKE